MNYPVPFVANPVVELPAYSSPSPRPLHLIPTPVAPPPKSALVAGLLQVFLGMGRFYLGGPNNVVIGIAQQVVGLLGVLLCVAGLFITVDPSQLVIPAVLLALGVVAFVGAGLWMWFDAALMIAGRVR